MDTFRADVKAELNKPEPKPEKGAKYIVQAGAFNKKEYAEAMVQKLKSAGFDAIVRLNGDVDADGKVTASDARSVLRKSVGLT
jgi:cell division septation protein DedD